MKKKLETLEDVLTDPMFKPMFLKIISNIRYEREKIHKLSKHEVKFKSTPYDQLMKAGMFKNFASIELEITKVSEGISTLPRAQRDWLFHTASNAITLVLDYYKKREDGRTDE